MAENEFDLLLETAMQDLLTKQEALQRDFGLDGMTRWWLDQACGTMQFFNEHDRLTVEAQILDIGSFSPKSETWKWSWSNDSVEPELRQKALPLKQLHDITGIDLFSNEQVFAIDGEAMAWDLAALAVYHLDALGCYRAPSGDDGPNIFLALTSLRQITYQ